MIDVAEAERLINGRVKLFPAEECPLTEADSRILREDIVADRDFPPADRATMDGIAIRFQAWQNGRRDFQIAGMQKAGAPIAALKDPQACVEIMTGALVPPDCDCVIPFEDIDVSDKAARLKNGIQPQAGQYIHKKAADYKKGEVLVKAGGRLLPPQVAIAASVGKATVKVTARPNIAVVSTGDELVDVAEPVANHQIRRSNDYAIQAALKRYGFNRSARFQIEDDREKLTTTLSRILDEFAVVILSGGVSLGRLDLVPAVLEELKVKVIFHKVRQKPGKPFWFGTRGATPVFALPGNPVSTQVCLYRYVLPFLQQASGLHGWPEQAFLADEITISNQLTNFVPVKITPDSSSRLLAQPVSLQTSGNYAALAGTNGFVELPAGKRGFKKGEPVRFYRW